MERIAQNKLLDPLSEVLALAEEEKKRRGLLYTPREIAQQPETWGTTFMICLDRSGTSAGSSNRRVSATVRDHHPR
jgi:hypothetical protein